MSNKEKKAFNDMAKRDRIRYEREMKKYVPPASSKGKAKKKKDPNAPKRPQSAFFLFCADFRADLKKRNPSWSVGEIAKELGRQWTNAKPAFKKKYTDKGEKEKAKYNKVMDRYRAQLAGRSSNSRAAEQISSEESESESD